MAQDVVSSPAPRLTLDALELQREISRFYHRWHALEARLGSDGGSVLDFDFCPREQLTHLEPPFGDRLVALQKLESLRDALSHSTAADFHNFEYLQQKLQGSSHYLRALMGQRYSFEEYLQACMGVPPEPATPGQLQALYDRVGASCEVLGLPFEGAREGGGLESIDQRMTERDHHRFAAELSEAATLWVARLHGLLALSAAPQYRIEADSVDAYWANWIDGSLDAGIRLRINLHPRISFHKGASVGYAVHEIGGHALHVLEMNLAREQGRMDSAGLNLTVHACEAFQMEGLAQTVLELVSEPSERSPELQFDIALRTFHSALLNNAQIALEAGAAMEEVIAWLMKTSPLIRPLRILADLRDRMRNPLFRSYIHVYAPSRRTFMTACALPLPERLTFLKKMYTGLYTPRQIRETLRELGVREQEG